MSLTTFNKIVELSGKHSTEGDYLEICNFLKEMYDTSELSKQKRCRSCRREINKDTIVPCLKYRTKNGNTEIYEDDINSSFNCTLCEMINQDLIWIGEINKYVSKYNLMQTQFIGFNKFLTKDITNKYFDKDYLIKLCKKGCFAKSDLRKVLKNNGFEVFKKHKKSELIELIENNL
jgi:hypothetical protein